MEYGCSCDGGLIYAGFSMEHIKYNIAEDGAAGKGCEDGGRSVGAGGWPPGAEKRNFGDSGKFHFQQFREYGIGNPAKPEGSEWEERVFGSP